MRKHIQWAATSLFGITLFPIITINIEKLAQENKWDGFLTSWWPEIMTYFSWASHPAVHIFAAFMGGVSIALLIVRIPPEQAATASSGTSMIDFERPKYSLYDGRERYSLLDAAFLWGDATPNPSPTTLKMFPEAMAGYQLLSEAIEDGKLPCFTVSKDGKIKTKTTVPKPSWIVKRPDLIEFANQIDIQPKFLFPESRSWMS